MGLIKLLIIAGIIYLLYSLVKKVLGTTSKIDQRKPNGVIDEMVQDPQCNTYVPRRQAKRKSIGGQEHFFCSNECAEKFEKAMKK